MAKKKAPFAKTPKPVGKKGPVKPAKAVGKPKPKAKLPTLGGGLTGLGGSGAQGGMA